MSKHENMDKHAMQAEGKRLMDLVKQIEVSPDIEQLMVGECDKAFEKGDECPPGTDIIYMPDVSGSMMPGGKKGWAWKTQEDIVQGVVPKAIQYDDGGIDIRPIRDTSLLEKLSHPTLECLSNVKDDKKALEYIRGFQNKLGSTPTRQLFAALVTETVKNAIADPANAKRHLYLISTDGKPDKHDKTMTQTTNEAIIALSNAGLDPRRYLAVSYIIITEDFHCMCGYLKLENRNTWGSEEKLIECDVANAMFPVLIKALGGFSNPLSIAIALAGPIRSEIDKSLELIMKGPAKELMQLMHAYNNNGYHNEDY